MYIYMYIYIYVYIYIYMHYHFYVLQGFCILYGHVMLCHNSWALDDGKISMSAISRHHGIQQARLADPIGNRWYRWFYFTKHLLLLLLLLLLLFLLLLSLLLLGNIIDNLRKAHWKNNSQRSQCVPRHFHCIHVNMVIPAVRSAVSCSSKTVCPHI